MSKKGIWTGGLALGVFALGLLLGMLMPICSPAETSPALDGGEPSQMSKEIEVVRKGSNDEKTEARDAISARREELVKELLGIARDEEIRLEEPKAAWLAIELLGEYRATEAVPTLLELLPYSPGDIPASQGYGTASSPRHPRRMPALIALIRIGKPSVAPAVKFLRKPDLDTPWGIIPDFIVWLLKCVEGDSGVELLKAALEDEKNPDVQERLQKCIDGYSTAVILEEVAQAGKVLLECE